MYRSFLIFAAAGAALLSTTPASAEAALTADEVARRAVVASPDVSARAHETSAADARESQARDGWIPTLTGGASYMRLSPIDAPNIDGLVFPIPVNQTEVHASLDIPLSDYLLRVSPSLTGAARNADAARDDQEAAKLRAAADGRVAYWQWLRARQALVVVEQARDAAQKHVADAEVALRAGTITTADRSRAESLEREAELNVERARSALTNGEAQLRVAMHDAWKGALEPGETIADDAPAGPDVGPLEDLIGRAATARPELRALSARAESVDSSASATRSALFPRLDAVAGASDANPNYRLLPLEEKFLGSWQVGGVLTWTPTDIPAVTAAARALDERRAALLADRATLLEAIRLEVTRAWTALRESRVAIATTAQRHTAADDSYRARTVQFQAGRATFVELADALTDLTRARLEALDAHAEERIARVSLERAVGSPALFSN